MFPSTRSLGRNLKCVLPALGVLTTAVAGCERAEPGGEQDGLRADSAQAQTAAVQVRLGSFSTAIDYAPFLVAQSKGWFDEAFRAQGATATYTTFETLPSINESFATNRVDIVFEAEPPAIIGKAAGTDIRIMGISASLRQEVIVPSSSSVGSISQLRGKKIAVLKGTSSHYGVLRILSASGLSDQNVTLVDMRPPDAKSAFESAQVDGWAVWPPWVEQETVAGRARSLPGAEAQIHSIMAVRGQFADQHPRLAQAAVEVLDRAKQWIAANPDSAQAIIAQRLGLPREVVAAAWPKHDWAATLSPAVVSDIQAKSDFLYTQGLIRNRVNVAQDLVVSSASQAR